MNKKQTKDQPFDPFQDQFEGLLMTNIQVAMGGKLIDSGMKETDALKLVIVSLCQSQEHLKQELFYYQSIAPRVIKVDRETTRP